MSAPSWTSADYCAWVRLINEARDCATKPSRAATHLARYVKQAFKAVIPTQDGAGRAQCFNFLRFAETFAALDAEGRAENANALADHAIRADGWVTPKRAPPPTEAPPAELPFRADLDG